MWPIEVIAEWVDRLAEPSMATNGLPICPYARRAFDDGKVAVFHEENVSATTLASLTDRWSPRYDIVLCLAPLGSITPNQAQDIVDRINQQLMTADIIMLVDHPDRPFVVDGHSNSNGKQVVFFIQRKSSLDKASEALRSAGYYRNWPGEE